MGSEPSESPNWPYITHLANCRNRNSPIDSSDESNVSQAPVPLRIGERLKRFQRRTRFAAPRHGRRLVSGKVRPPHLVWPNPRKGCLIFKMKLQVFGRWRRQHQHHRERLRTPPDSDGKTNYRTRHTPRFRHSLRIQFAVIRRVQWVFEMEHDRKPELSPRKCALLSGNSLQMSR